MDRDAPFRQQPTCSPASSTSPVAGCCHTARARHPSVMAASGHISARDARAARHPPRGAENGNGEPPAKGGRSTEAVTSLSIVASLPVFRCQSCACQWVRCTATWSTTLANPGISAFLPAVAAIGWQSECSVCRREPHDARASDDRAVLPEVPDPQRPIDRSWQPRESRTDLRVRTMRPPVDARESARW